MSTTNEIMDLAGEWAQETKDFGHLDESRPRDALLKAVEALVASCCTGRETMSLLKLDQSGCEIESVPPLVKWAKSAHLPPLTPTSTFQRFDGGKTVQAHTDAAMREYGELCHKQALEEAAKFCESQQVNHSPRGTKIFLPFDSECMGTHEGIYYAKAIRELK